MKTILKYIIAIIIIAIASVFLLLHGMVFCINYTLLKFTGWILRKKSSETLTTIFAVICFIPKILTDLFSNISNYLYGMAVSLFTRER